MSFDEVSVDDLENYKQYQDNKGEKSDKKESNKLSLQLPSLYHVVLQLQ